MMNVKRCFDVVAAAIGLIMLSPLILLLSLLVRTKLGSPVFFRQMRPGLNAKPFEMVKFRTMLNEVDASGKLLPDEHRLTTFGRILRSTSLDELPELWNVLKGEMSLVGPRLLRDKGIYEYIDAARRVRERYPHAVFHLVGPIDSNPSRIREQDLDAWISEGLIQFHGYLPEVNERLAACHVYVLPSYREGTPRSVLEALATGRAVITTDAPGCRETVVRGENGFLVPVKDAGALAEAMENFLKKPDLIKSMGQRSREIAEQKYDVRLVNSEMIQHMGVVA